MNEQIVKGKRKRHGFRAIKWVVRLMGAVALFFSDKLHSDFQAITRNSRLFAGVASFAAGLLLFESGRYCDGNAASYYASCTRPSTYYYYPWWAILLVILGSFSIVLWFLQKK